MTGRYPAGPEYVEHLEGSPQAKERALAILKTLTGELRLQEACDLLAICPQRFHQLREEMLQAAVSRMEARPAGRPRQATEPAEIVALRQRVAELEEELRLAEVREEIALALPGVVVAGMAEEVPPGKKLTARPGRRPEMSRS